MRVSNLIVVALIAVLSFSLSSCGELGEMESSLRIQHLVYSLPKDADPSGYGYRVFIESIDVGDGASPLTIDEEVNLADELVFNDIFKISTVPDGATLVIHTSGIATVTTPFPSTVAIPEELEGVVHHLESGMLEKGWERFVGDEYVLNLYFDISSPTSIWFFAVTSPTTDVSFDLGTEYANATVTVEIPDFSIYQTVSTSITWNGVRATNDWGMVSLRLPDPRGFGSYTVRVSCDSTEVQKTVGE